MGAEEKRPRKRFEPGRHLDDPALAGKLAVFIAVFVIVGLVLLYFRLHGDNF
ncbi:MAG TPA: hypothetical protein VL688_10280 [Verrucomicrobiae bacterium]|nr:hypothetical protein [Verrucomicrobiae bacterium]